MHGQAAFLRPPPLEGDGAVNGAVDVVAVAMTSLADLHAA